MYARRDCFRPVIGHDNDYDVLIVTNIQEKKTRLFYPKRKAVISGKGALFAAFYFCSVKPFFLRTANDKRSMIHQKEVFGL